MKTWWEDDKLFDSVTRTLLEQGEASTRAIEELTAAQQRLAEALAGLAPDESTKKAVAALNELSATQASVMATLDRIAKVIRAPEVHVAAPTVKIDAPVVTVKPEIKVEVPAGPRRWVFSHRHDAAGNIRETIATAED